MTPCTVSDDLKSQIPALYHDVSYNTQKICDILAVKKILTYKTLTLFLQYGVINNPHKCSCIGGHLFILSQSHHIFVHY
ncbi:hypothetical protein PAXRUDRAFT_148767 [Paxillus rubicundulus Ve08.2h10]|uniref:Uncharacterized protein n=1 Tax=Paxillus rubicundulus Ve08.2h10 TaxID=930991 RepID=A0A0D0DYK8_9AGAM|nr:hypothetical protein PAXRUDRAFT_148767 [Paxillus rubicundulus Ve08.2h10]